MHMCQMDIFNNTCLNFITQSYKITSNSSRSFQMSTPLVLVNTPSKIVKKNYNFAILFCYLIYLFIYFALVGINFRILLKRFKWETNPDSRKSVLTETTGVLV